MQSVVAGEDGSFCVKTLALLAINASVQPAVQRGWDV